MSSTRGLSILRSEIKYEQMSYWRNFRAAFFTFLFPIIFLCAFGLPNRNSTPELDGVPVPFGLIIIPGIMAFALTQACYTNLAIVLSIRRQTGQLMRRRATPVPPAMLIGGMIGSSIVISALLVVVVTGFGAAFFHTGFPDHIFPIIAGFVLAAVCFGALGVLVQSIIKDADSAPPLINLPLMLLAFISGNFFAVDTTGTPGMIAGWFPLQHLNNIIRAGFSPATHGVGLDGGDVLNLVIWSVVAIYLGAKKFQWAPKTQ